MHCSGIVVHDFRCDATSSRSVTGVPLDEPSPWLLRSTCRGNMERCLDVKMSRLTGLNAVPSALMREGKLYMSVFVLKWPCLNPRFRCLAMKKHVNSWTIEAVLQSNVLESAASTTAPEAWEMEFCGQRVWFLIAKTILGGALIYFLLFGPFWERLFQLTNIFGKASNHQLV